MGFALSSMQLASPAFEPGGAIPRKYTGEGEDISPPLSWQDAPVDARSFAIFCHDPDAPLVTPGSYGFVHWCLYNIPQGVAALSANANAFTQGGNDFGKQGYGGPMPPLGHGTHHYYFWLLALKGDPDLPPDLGLRELLERIESRVVGMNRLVGTYRRDQEPAS